MIKCLVTGTIPTMVIGALAIVAGAGDPVPILFSSFLIGAIVALGVEGTARILSRYKIVKK